MASTERRSYSTRCSLSRGACSEVIEVSQANQRTKAREATTYPLLNVAENLSEAVREALGFGALPNELLLHPDVLSINLGVAPPILLTASRELSRGREGEGRSSGGRGSLSIVAGGEPGRSALQRLPHLAVPHLEVIAPLPLSLQLLL